MNLIGKRIKLTSVDEKKERGLLEGVLETELVIGGVSFLRNKKRLINTGLITAINWKEMTLDTESTKYKIEIVTDE